MNNCLASLPAACCRRFLTATRCLFLTIPLLLSVFGNPAAASQLLHGHMLAAIKNLTPEAELAGTNRLNLAIGLPLRNTTELSNLLVQIYDPASPNYHHYLTPELFTERFGPTAADYEAVVAFAKANHLAVTGRYANRMLVDVSGTVTEVEKVLHVNIHTYRHPKENRMFYAPDSEPSLDLSVPVLYISGLDNYVVPKPLLHPMAAGAPQPAAGSGPSGAFMGSDFRNAYAPGVTLTGTGQSVGLLQFESGFYQNDITAYENQAGLPNVPVQPILLDGYNGGPGIGNDEVSLDIEMVISMAPAVSNILVFEGKITDDILNAMAASNQVKQLSASWSYPIDATSLQIFQQFAAQGQSFFNASGDYDAWVGSIPSPCDDPYITIVGGTMLTTGAGGAWSSETVWNRGNGIGSGGGISTTVAIPGWQTNISMTANQGSTTMRNIPDVAMTAENVWVIFGNGRSGAFGGTSCATPLWAGFAALINQQAAGSAQSPIGFINPTIYALATNVNYTTYFHDITTGNNTSGSSPGEFHAVAGYDLCTGLGTPAGQPLINALANPEPLIISPQTGFSSLGGVGGPFTVEAETFSLTNAGTNSLSWTLVNTSAWLNASSTSGTLPVGSPPATVTVSLNNTASNLVVGTYAATLWFTNLVDGVGQDRSFALSVISPPSITQQPASESVLDGAAASFSVTAAGGLPLSYQWQYNGTNLTDGGNITGSSTTNLTVSNVSSGQVGAYSVVATNYAGSTVSSNALLAITPSVPVITRQPASLVAVAGTAAHFSVAAIGSKPFTYQWSFNNTNIQDATNATLALSDVQLTNAGNYSVIISNTIGSTTSSNAVLDVVYVPFITSFSPGAAQVGTNVTITGANFSSNSTNDIVYFGAVQATVLSASPTNLVVMVPAGATYAPITVTVHGLTAYADSPFLPVFFGGDTLGASSFVGPTNLTAGNGPARLAMGDLDGDGKPDLVVANAYDGSIWIYRNISANGTLSAASFAPPVEFWIGGGTDSQYGLALADLTGDGRLDIVTVNKQLNLLSIFQNFCSPGNLTSNSFARVDISIGGAPSSVAVADLDSDGQPDIMVAVQGSNMVSVLRNLSNGGSLSPNSFAAPVSFATGPSPWVVAVADMDGDGKPDVVTVNQADPNHKVSILRNLGLVAGITTNSLAPTVDLAGADTGETLAVGDLDGDGKPDVVVGSYVGNTMAVYRNESTPGNLTTATFADPVVFNIGARVHSVAIGDLDGDGKPDVAVVTQFPSQLSLFKNLSTPGSFTSSSLGPQLNFAAGNNAVGVTIGDLAGDGRADLVFGNVFDNTVSVYRNEIPFGGPPIITSQPIDQAAILGSMVGFSVTAGGALPLNYQWYFNQTNPLAGATNISLTLTHVQFTNAGLYSVLVANGLGSEWSSNAVLTVNPIPTNVPVIISFSPGSAPTGTNVTITGANFSSNPTNDIVYFGAVQASVISASPTNLVVMVPAGATYAPITVTVYGLTAYADSPFLPVFLSGGALGASSFAGPTNLSGGSGPSRVVIGDLDGDGKPDVVVANAYDGSIWIYRNLSTNGTLATASFAAPVKFAIGGGIDSQYGLTLADLTGDGRLDIVTANRNLDLLSIFQNFSSPGSLTSNSFGARVDITIGGTPTSVAVADLDGDGKPDIVTANLGNSSVSVLQNIFAGGAITANSFAAPVNFSVGGQPFWVSIADLDRDGKPDVVTSDYNSSSTVSVLRNVSSVGSIAFAASVEFPGLGSGGSVAVGDLDGDGKPDLVVGSQSTGQAVSIYRNTSTPGSITTSSFAAPLNLSANGWANMVTIGDLDGDGKPDVVEVSSSGYLSVFRNLCTPGNLLFGSRIDYVSGSNPNGVAIGDLDGDGRPDLFCANQGGNTESVYRNVIPILSAPVITSQPVSQTNEVNTTATFSVAATGTIPLSYQWYFNETNLLAGMTNATLILTNVQFTNAGSYSVVVTNIYGSVTSSNATLNVFANPPSIISQPLNQIVFAGDPANFYVTVSGTAPLSYQWYFNQTNQLNGATNASLTLTNVQPGQAGNYSIFVTNDYGSTTSSNATLSVITLPPTITTQPSNQTVAVNASANFTVAAGGTAPLTYQWYFNQTNLLAGATNASLTLANVQPGRAGVYSVLVTNAYGSITSSNAILNVVYVPFITSFSPGAAQVGTNVTITGANFSSNSTNDIVYFGAVQATVVSASPTNLVVLVPAGATYAPITVTVHGLTAYADSPFLPVFFGGDTLGDSSFVGPTNLTAGNGPARLAMGDLDGDGKPDLVVANAYDGSIWIYRNISTNGTLSAASFAPPVEFWIGGGTDSQYGLALADLTGDGRLDIVTVNKQLNLLSIFQNFCSPGNLTSNSFARVDISIGGAPSSVAVADLDSDGQPDIMVAVQGSNMVSVLRNLGNGGSLSSNSFAAPVNFATGPSPWVVAVADMDGDGKPDVVTVNQGDPNHKISILRNLGMVEGITTNSFAPTVDLAGADTGEALAVGDLDGDGKPDVVVGSYIGSTMAVYRNESTPGNLTTATFADPVVFSPGASVHSVAIGDLDGDGRPDVVTTTQPGQVLLYKNLSTPGSFTSSSLGPQINLPSGQNTVGIAIGDLDGDGRPDLVCGNTYDNSVSVYQNEISFGGPPSITTEPTNQTLALGGTASFNITATGTVPLIYQWYFNQTNLLIGATNASLTLADVQFTDAGTYSVLVTNIYGSATSSNVTLSVYAIPPSITSQPTNQNVALAGTATFNVTATGSAPLIYQWYFDQTNLLAGATNATLTLTNVQFTNAGIYSVLVTNVAGSQASSNAVLSVYAIPPSISSQPKNQTVLAGTTVYFSVNASGTAPLTYQWFFNQTNALLDATNTSLTLTNVQLADSGLYSVLVTNLAGFQSSSNAVLTVNPLPTNVPVIYSFSPAAAVKGAYVSVAGTNFSPIATSNSVYFGAVQASVISASPTNLVVMVPAGATYAPITVTVHGLTAYADSPFLPVFLSGGALGASSFAGPTNLSGGSGPSRVVIGDLDGDGKPDVVVANAYDGSIWIYRNLSTNGTLATASFAAPVKFAIGGGIDSQYGLTLADLTGDGRLDIVTANRNLNLLSIFQNFSSPGSLTSNSFGARVDITIAGTPTSVAVADLDGDGKPDIVTANLGNSSVSVLQNIFAGGAITANSFAAPVNFSVGGQPFWVSIADLDGDGKPDVVTSDYNSSSTVSVLRNVSSVGSIAFAASVEFPGLGSGGSVAVGDLDGDGKPDLVVGSQSTGRAVSIYRNTSTPGSITTSSFAAPLNLPANGWANMVTIGDLDGDGKPDVVMVSSSSHLSVFRNLCTPGSITANSFGPRVDFNAGSNPNGVAIGDLDEDGRPDLFCANQGANTVSVYRNTIAMAFAPALTSQPTNQTTIVTGTANFVVTASGTAPLSYQWYFNQTNLLAGMTNATLTLTNVQFTNAGNYSVVVTNNYGTAISSNAILTVIDALNHFTWNSIPAQRFVNVPFTVTIKAIDPTNGIFTNFNGTVRLNSTNGILVNPPVSANFVQGSWTGSLAVSQPATNLVLRADDGLGQTGLANAISVAYPPSLVIQPSGSTLVFFWPLGSSNFVLESTPALSPANWTPVSATPITVGNQYLVPIPMSPTNGFYRLRFTGQ